MLLFEAGGEAHRLEQVTGVKPSTPNSSQQDLYFQNDGTLRSIGFGLPEKKYLTGDLLRTGKVVYVDSVYGDDGTGARERQDLPFFTLAAAMTAALANDT